MAKNTNIKLRGLNVYQVFLRQHKDEGTFLSLIKDLPRIKSFGMDYIYLLPIHPIGEVERKGKVGSPYSVKDYKAVDSSFGTLEDFDKLVQACREIDLKIMLDMVFHHTSLDAKLYSEHPNYYLKENHMPMRKVTDWWDVIDLDFKEEGLHDYLIDVLKFWTNHGVSGFRFDVASLIPLEFWDKAKSELKKINNEILFLGESVHLRFVKGMRDEGHMILSDSELYQVFDILYDYDIEEEYSAYLKDPKKLNDWLKVIMKQESIYPENYIKLRNLENHDTNRVAFFVEDKNRLLNLTGLLGYLKGAMMIYAGQEYGCIKRPNLFELDKIDFTENNSEIKNLLHRISHLRKDDLFHNGSFKIHLKDIEVAVVTYENDTSIAYGIFNLGSEQKEISISLKDGVYQNILYPNQVKVINGLIRLTDKPMILFAMKKQI